MNIRQNINQSWQIIKQNKLYSFFYILGTALAISMIMVLAIGYNLRVGNIYPETNRDRTMVINYLREKPIGGCGFSAGFLEKIFSGVEGVERLGFFHHPKSSDVQKNVFSEIQERRISYSDQEIWTIYEFDFIAGKPFTKADVESSIQRAVISASTAKLIYGRESVVGEKIWINYKEFTVSGVVKDVSPLMSDSYADVYLPYTLDVQDTWITEISKTGMAGLGYARILAKSSKDFDKIKTQVNENLAKLNSTFEKGAEIDLIGYPKSFAENNLTKMSWGAEKNPSMTAEILQIILIILVIILVPALNLSGIISTEMEGREAELGIRKAFGAPRSRLLLQLLNENMLLSFIGGVLGLGISYLIIFFGFNWFLNFLGSSVLGDNLWLGMEMLINYKIFIIGIIVCMLMNILSSIIPLYFSSRKNIIALLNREQEEQKSTSKGKKSLWIFLELVAVFIITWMVIDPLYVLNYQKSIDNGFEYEDLYTISISPISEKSPLYEKETKEEVAERSKMILDLVRNHPLVEEAIVNNYHSIMNGRIGSASVKRPTDSVEVSVSRTDMSTDPASLSVYGITTFDALNKADIRENTVLISKSLAEKLFGKKWPVGERLLYGGRNEERIILGVVDDIKRSEYEVPVPTVIKFSTPYSGETLRLSLLVKAKPGISEGEFISVITEELGYKLNIGSRLFRGIYPYSKEVETSHNSITIKSEKNTYTILAFFVLINLFIGIFATFWLQSKKRRGEIGLRMAMGGTKQRITGMFLIESVKMTSLAVLVGVLAVGNIVYFKGMFSYGDSSYMIPSSFEYWPIDNTAAHFIIVTLIVYALILLAVAIATIIPASKAANTNPVDALRDE